MLSAQVTTAQHMEREKAYDKVSLCALLHLSFPHSFVFPYMFVHFLRLPRP